MVKSRLYKPDSLNSIAEIAAFSQIYKENINTVCEKNVEMLNANLTVHILTNVI